eukprot:940456-Rhodomonas_salina.2
MGRRLPSCGLKSQQSNSARQANSVALSRWHRGRADCASAPLVAPAPTLSPSHSALAAAGFARTHARPRLVPDGLCLKLCLALLLEGAGLRVEGGGWRV